MKDLRRFPVSEWVRAEPLSHPRDAGISLRPVMPDGSMELIDGTWLLPSGEQVVPVMETADER